MNYRIILISVVSFLFLTQINVEAQDKSQNEYLQKVGLKDSFYSEVLNESRTFYVQLPANYNPEKLEQYPVVYVLDGEVFLPTVNNALEFYSGGFMPEMVIVGISNAENRMRDLTTSKVNEMYGQPFNVKNGEASNLIEFLEEELFPFVESKYPVTKYRTLIGHSYGGLFVCYALLNHSHLFENYIAIDPSLDWDNQDLIKQAKEKLEDENFDGKSLFVSLSGQLHMQNPAITIDNVMEDDSDFTIFARSNIEFSEMIKANPDNGLIFDWKFYAREIHGTIPFPSIMDGLIGLFAWFQMENTDKFNSPETPINELSEIINYRAEKLQDHFGYDVAPYPEDLLNILGYMSMDMEQIEKAKMFFEFAIEFYPQSANAYDSLAEFYERTEDNEKALINAKKAYELNDDNYFKQRLEEIKAKK